MMQRATLACKQRLNNKLRMRALFLLAHHQQHRFRACVVLNLSLTPTRIGGTMVRAERRLKSDHRALPFGDRPQRVGEQHELLVRPPRSNWIQEQ
jgi:hypothetical protein